jgi:signal transduction histidine kinase
VFSHTERGVALRLEVRNEPGAVVVAVADEGPGFPKGVDAVRRGVSAAGSTGLGLDIARRLGERTGGGLRLAASPAGGALVELRLGQAAPA